MPAHRKVRRSAGGEPRPGGFTLVELLVVIGIIALLVGILLPALSSARRQAQAVKCAASLKEIGNAYQLYAIDNRGYYPPSQLLPPVKGVYDLPTYEVNGVSYPNAGYGAYWFNFLAKYVTKTKVGLESTNASDTEQQRMRSLFWSCPSFDGYYTGSTGGGGYNRLQTGYGMNSWPTFRPDYPAAGQNFPPARESAYMSGSQGSWHKQIEWTRNGSNRALVADSRFWNSESNPPPATGPWPASVVAQPIIDVYTTYTASVPGQTMLDLYRHGKYPGRQANATFDPRGGKIAFNVLYCDGHVATATTGQEAYRATRMKFPG